MTHALADYVNLITLLSYTLVLLFLIILPAVRESLNSWEFHYKVGMIVVATLGIGGVITLWGTNPIMASLCIVVQLVGIVGIVRVQAHRFDQGLIYMCILLTGLILTFSFFIYTVTFVR